MNLIDHLEKLKYFHEVARLGSMKKASEVILISQPSLTKSIKILEETIGSPLFIRLPRGVKLTKEGNTLFNFSQKLFVSITNIEQNLTRPNDPFSGSLNIGTYDSIAIYFWPNFLKKVITKHIHLDIHLTTGRSIEIQEKLEAGKLDLALIVDPKESKNIAVEMIKTDYFNFYESTLKKKVYKKIEDAPIIFMPSATIGRDTLADLVLKMKTENRKQFSTSSLESVKELTLNGLGIGLLPEMIVKKLVKQKKIKKVSTQLIKNNAGVGSHQIGIAYNRHKKESVLIKNIIHEIKKEKL